MRVTTASFFLAAPSPVAGLASVDRPCVRAMRYLHGMGSCTLFRCFFGSEQLLNLRWVYSHLKFGHILPIGRYDFVVGNFGPIELLHLGTWLNDRFCGQTS